MKKVPLSLDRRDFIKLSCASAIGGIVSGCDPDDSSSFQNHHDGGADADGLESYDIVLSGGQILDNGTFKAKDIGIKEGVVVRISQQGELDSAPTANRVSCKEQYICPGWVDTHCHVGNIGVGLDLLGAPMGVTAVVDNGSWGPANFDEFLSRFVENNPHQIGIYSLLNLKPFGLIPANLTTAYSDASIDLEGVRRIVEQHPDLVIGLKVIADSMVASKADPLHGARETAALARKLSLPVTFHFGGSPPSLKDILAFAAPRHTLTHCFKPNPNSIVGTDGNILSEVINARAEGLQLDLGHGRSSFSWKTAQAAFDNNFTDFTISSDLHLMNRDTGVISFANVLTKMFSLGFSLEEIISRASVLPRNRLDLETQIEEGTQIDLTLFSIRQGSFQLYDANGVKRESNKRIIPEYAIVKGVLIRAGDRDRKFFSSV